MPSIDIPYLEMTVSLHHSTQDHMVEQQSMVEFPLFLGIQFLQEH